MLHQTSGKAARVFTEFSYQTHKSWSRARRVVAKAEYLDKGENPRFVVTSLTAEQWAAQDLYEKFYCARGEMENRIKEQMCLFADRLSTDEMKGNQLRLYFSALAYTLIEALRRLGLKGTAWAEAQVDTIRLKLLKIGAIVRHQRAPRRAPAQLGLSLERSSTRTPSTPCAADKARLPRKLELPPPLNSSPGGAMRKMWPRTCRTHRRWAKSALGGLPLPPEITANRSKIDCAHAEISTLEKSRLAVRLRVVCATRDGNVGHAVVEQVFRPQLGIRVDQHPVGGLPRLEWLVTAYPPCRIL